MEIRILRPRRRLVVAVSGLGAVFALLLALTLLDRLEGELGPKQAEQRIRQFYRGRVSYRHLDALKSSGLRVPDPQTASLWEKELSEIDRMQFFDVELKRPWIDLLSDLPNHLVRAKFRDQSGRMQLHCFWLSAYRFDRELPTWCWYVLF